MKHFFRILSLLFLGLGYNPSALAQTGPACPTPGKVRIKVQVHPDANASDQTSWSLISQAGDTLLKGKLSDSICVDSGLCVRFRIVDLGNNGLCCTNGNGFYRLWYGSLLVRQSYKFKNQETQWVGCTGCVPDSSQEKIRIYIHPDRFPDETSWVLTKNNADTIARGKSFGDTLCVPKNACLRFTIKDLYGDGMCCNQGDGGYQIYGSTGLLALGNQFGLEESRNFRCPPGFGCSSALPVSPGDTLLTQYEDHWYRFIPTQSGTYKISTCFPQNNCQTKIWVYDYCQGLIPTENNVATIAYSEEGCGNQALLLVNLTEGQLYYIRIGDYLNSCTQPIRWSFGFNGPVVGCMDPLSCTYNPVATVSDTSQCLYMPDSGCPDLPDFRIDTTYMKNSFRYDSLINNDACFVLEGCLRGYGKRYLARFSTKIDNIGEADYYIGRPPVNRNILYEAWVWDPCHNHWHYKDYAEYLLFDKQGNPIPAGFKAGYCVLDHVCPGGGVPKYNCAFQGISRGCTDIYYWNSKCQWVDITDVDTGSYTVVVRVNWDNSPDTLGRIEKTRANNWGQFCIKISKNSSGRRFVTRQNQCSPFVDCNGEPFGSAERDCKGNCNGTARKGDINGDYLVDSVDFHLYSRYLLDSLGYQVQNCTDLFDDDSLTVADGQLLAECLAAQASAPIGVTPEICGFNLSIHNPTHEGRIRVDSLHIQEGFADLSIQNPFDEIKAFDLKINGLNIDSAALLLGGDSGKAYLDFRPEGRIICNLMGRTIPRNPGFTPFLRVYFDTIGSLDTICIGHVRTLVNRTGETFPGYPAGCQVSPDLVQIAPLGQGPALRIIPNPMEENCHLQILGSTKADQWTVFLQDIRGKRIGNPETFWGPSYNLNRKGLSSGMYFLYVNGPRQYSAKLLIR
jgi:hypothetical protein